MMEGVKECRYQMRFWLEASKDARMRGMKLMSNMLFRCLGGTGMIYSPSGAAQWKAPHNVDNLWTNENSPTG